MSLQRIAVALLLPALLFAVAAAPAPAPSKWAVVVGVNDYVAYTAEDGDLRGAVRDARAMRDVLVERWGVPDGNVRLLTDRAATKAAIRALLVDWLPERARPGDLVVFFYAGHGSQAYDSDGDEADGLDETLGPTDIRPSSFENDITDDELGAWIRGLPTAEVVVILDSCHSGTATRLAGTGMRPRFLDRGARARGEPAASERADAPPPPEGGEAPELDLPSGDGGLLEIASAAPDQSAMDAWFPASDDGEGYSGGAFTTHFVRQLRRAPATATYRELFRATVAAMKADGFEQDPQLSGPAAEPVFRAAGVAAEAGAPEEEAAEAGAADPATPGPPGTLRVVAVAGSSVRLDAGSAAGVTRGSVYRGEGGAVVRIARVRADGAAGTVLRGEVARGARLRIAARPVASPGLAVDVTGLPAALRAGIGARYGGDDRIRLAAGGEEAAEAGAGSGAADLYLRPSDDESGGVAVYGRDGRVRSPVRAGGAGGPLLDRLARRLERELAVKALAALENPTGGFAIDVELAGSDGTFAVDDTLAFRVRSSRRGYLTLLDLGPDGAVTVLYPNAYVEPSPLEAGEAVTIPTAEMPFALVARPPTGWGLVRALVTDEPLELPTVSGGLLSAEDGSALVERVARALREGAGGSAGAADGDAVPVSGWATTMVSYRISAGE